MASRIVDMLANADKTTGAIDLAKRVNELYITGRYNFALLTYTLDGTEAAADTINLLFGMQGMTIIPEHSFITSDGAATTLTVDVGDLDPTAAPQRYCAGANVAAANARVLFSATGNPAAAVAPYTLLANAWIQATLATVGTPVAGKKLRFGVAYIGA